MNNIFFVVENLQDTIDTTYPTGFSNIKFSHDAIQLIIEELN